MTNAANAVVIALATASIGGIFSSTATDMGTQVGIPRIILKETVLILKTRAF